MSALLQILKDRKIKAVIHFAGLKAAGESCTFPLNYHNNNSTPVLYQATGEANVKKLVFSSSAAVYGAPSRETLPLTEQAALPATNPYWRSKLIIEEMLRNLPTADTLNNALPYFAISTL